jgi:hypothetical protein
MSGIEQKKTVTGRRRTGNGLNEIINVMLPSFKTMSGRRILL